MLSGGGLRVWAEYVPAGEIGKDVIDGVVSVLGNIKDLVIACGLTKETASILLRAISKTKNMDELHNSDTEAPARDGPGKRAGVCDRRVSSCTRRLAGCDSRSNHLHRDDR